MGVDHGGFHMGVAEQLCKFSLRSVASAASLGKNRASRSRQKCGHRGRLRTGGYAYQQLADYFKVRFTTVGKIVGRTG
jgi:hypothetical protein